MTTLATTTPRFLSTTGSRRRLATAALWTVQIAVSALFFLAGTAKLAGAPPMVAMFGAIGLGQWFRYVTGAIEVVAAVALLLPSAAVFGALLLVPTMLGAIATHLLVVGGSPVPAVSLLIGALIVLGARRHQLADAWSRLR